MLFIIPIQRWYRLDTKVLHINRYINRAVVWFSYLFRYSFPFHFDFVTSSDALAPLWHHFLHFAQQWLILTPLWHHLLHYDIIYSTLLHNDSPTFPWPHPVTIVYIWLDTHLYFPQLGLTLIYLSSSQSPHSLSHPWSIDWRVLLVTHPHPRSSWSKDTPCLHKFLGLL